MASEKPAKPDLKMNIVAQYIKDLSFENNHFIDLLKNPPKEPKPEINCDVQTKNLEDNRYEVSLSVRIHLKDKEKTLYLLDLVYAGAFMLECSEPEMIPIILNVECPRLIYPATRQQVVTLTQDSGLPPLSMTPAIDFAALYHKKLSETKAKKA